MPEGQRQSQNLNTQVATLREGIQRMEAQLRDLETRETELFDTLPTADNPDAENKAHLTALLDQRVAAEAARGTRALEMEAREQRGLARGQYALFHYSLLTINCLL